MNHLKNQTSPYLLQHADNPVDWFPWCEEAFSLAEKENKPIFLSIGYSTCHWCHVMAQESFEDEEIAEILNRYFICIKVDKEERPDIDYIYMEACQALTGSGGWPATLFLTPEKKPFFAGTYFPKHSMYGRIGLKELLFIIHEKWTNDRTAIMQSSEKITFLLNRNPDGEDAKTGSHGRQNDYLAQEASADSETESAFFQDLLQKAYQMYALSFDKKYGGFGTAPKFPTPHHYLFLMRYYEKTGETNALQMAEKSLYRMYLGGLFDHIGGGFCRYSTDQSFLVPHFEKMLYDNALLISAYCKAYQLTKKECYLEAAKKTADYILREMTDTDGGFYSAQDADSEGEEGKFYLFEPSEIKEVLGEKDGEAFNRYYDITEKGNFAGKSIPNLLKQDRHDEDFSASLEKLYHYRKSRYQLHTDDNILTGWNGLMIAALSRLYRITGRSSYLNAAKNAEKYIEAEAPEEQVLYVSCKNGTHGETGFLNDYANMIYGLLSLYEATLELKFLKKALRFCDKALASFYDEKHGGFFLYGEENEKMILRPKEVYDGAMPSGNAVMSYNLIRLYFITEQKRFQEYALQQFRFIRENIREYPMGYAMHLSALSDYLTPPDQVTIVPDETGLPKGLSCKIPPDTVIRILESPNEEYPLKDHKTTFYICRNFQCNPPVNQIDSSTFFAD